MVKKQLIGMLQWARQCSADTPDLQEGAPNIQGSGQKDALVNGQDNEQKGSGYHRWSSLLHRRICACISAAGAALTLI